ncbi:SDR family oxidoreductase [Streptomyces sp. NPDC057638]|uniref:SDR family oxidoreductase n=1 Tax=Streptomyces sp. NPDC057638 TaxID=3346190 RepID=UPI0036CEF33A
MGRTGLCEGRVVVVTGAGRGLGRAHALAYAAEGARVVINDLPDPAGSPARRVVNEIRAGGGDALAHEGDIAADPGAADLIGAALRRWGRVDTLVNNAGTLRDRMLVNLAEDDWDSVLKVHVTGSFLPLRHAAEHWRERAKRGTPVSARVINTTSGAGLLGSVGQANYAAAKAGVIALTLVAAAELARYGVQVNAIAPVARTRMTEAAFPGLDAPPEDVSPLVVWLGSAASDGVTGRVFEAESGRISVMEGWRRGPTAESPIRWTPTAAGETARTLLARSEPPGTVYGAG